MVFKLYGSPRSNYVMLVAAVLHETNVPYELVPVDMAKKEHKQPQYLEKHPFGEVPYIVAALSPFKTGYDDWSSQTI